LFLVFYLDHYFNIILLFYNTICNFRCTSPRASEKVGGVFFLVFREFFFCFSYFSRFSLLQNFPSYCTNTLLWFVWIKD